MADVADYTPKVAVVTGAAQGIGRAIALRLAADGFGIAAADLHSKQDKLDSLVKEITTNGRKAVAIPTDVTKEEEVMKLIELTVQELGGVDVVRLSLSSCLPTPQSERLVPVDGCECWDCEVPQTLGKYEVTVRSCRNHDTYNLCSIY